MKQDAIKLTTRNPKQLQLFWEALQTSRTTEELRERVKVINNLNVDTLYNKLRSFRYQRKGVLQK